MSNTGIPLSDLGGVPAARFEALGEKVAGRIVTVRREQQRDFESGQGMTWANGDPRMELRIVLATPDAGEVMLYARGGTYENIAEGQGLSMEAAIVKAVQDAGGPRSIDPGAELAVAHTGIAKPSKVGLNGAKLYLAQYKPPKAAAVNVDDLFDEPF